MDQYVQWNEVCQIGETTTLLRAFRDPKLVPLATVPLDFTSDKMDSELLVFYVTNSEGVLHSYRVCNGVHPSNGSILHSCNVVSVWSLPEMSTVCHNVAEITCGRAAHTGVLKLGHKACDRLNLVIQPTILQHPSLTKYETIDEYKHLSWTSYCPNHPFL